MATPSRKRDREEHPDAFPNADHSNKKKRKKARRVLDHQEAQAQPSELNAENPHLLPPKPELTLPNDPAQLNEPSAALSQLCPIPDSTPAEVTEQRKKKRKKKRLPKREGAELNDVDANHLELCPKLDSDPVLPPKPEPAPRKEPEQKTKKRRRRKKNKGVLNGEGVESDRPNCEHPQLCHKPEPTAPKGQHGELLPEPEPVTSKEPDQKKKRGRRRRKIRSVLNDEGVESNSAVAENPQLFFKVDTLPSKDSAPAVLPEPQPAQKKGKSVLNGEGTESNGPNAELPQLITENNPLPSMEPALKEEKKSVLNGEGAGLSVQETPSNNHEPFMRCSMCGLGHKSNKCPRVQGLPSEKEICFFCGDFDHRVGKCPMSPGVKFPSCSLCNERGHFRRNCPLNSRSIHPKGVRASMPSMTRICPVFVPVPSRPHMQLQQRPRPHMHRQ